MPRLRLAAGALALAVGIGLGAGGVHAGRPSATIWLCRPGAPADPCGGDLAATAVAASGARTVQPASPSPQSRRFDCFYVYPTVSSELTANADLRVQPAERLAAREQAARFSQVCLVWAPMYRQQTLASLLVSAVTGNRAPGNVAYRSLLTGWRAFLDHAGGRPFVLIGHSQGAAMLIRLIRERIDPDPAMRSRLVSAILLGGNVEVPAGRGVGGSFRHVPACTAASQTGCVIAYSSFPGLPPANSLFGRAGQGASLLSGLPQKRGLRVLCVNPAALGAAGSTGDLEPYFTRDVVATPGPPVGTRWVTYPGLYTARCRTGGGATWLQVDTSAAPADRRPRIAEDDGPEWGYHTFDVNVALGNLVADVRAEERAYRR